MSVPFIANLQLLLCNQHTARMRVFACNLIIIGEIFTQLLTKTNHLKMKRHILHRQIRAIRFTAKRHSFHLDKRRQTTCNQPRIISNIAHIPRLHQSQPIHSSLSFLPQIIQREQESLPIVFKQRSINGLERVFGGGVHRDIQLCDRLHIFDLVGKLGIGHQERRDGFGVQQLEILVDERIHNGLSHQRQRAMFDSRLCFL
mmetsp:Transcript_60325/g.95780  ORF Transcript_60325/g.95780 Transcript_60325/m.95780 type:complete len:201 (+) Transcript_60325:508-1110(+)